MNTQKPKNIDESFVADVAIRARAIEALMMKSIPRNHKDV